MVVAFRLRLSPNFRPITEYFEQMTTDVGIIFCAERPIENEALLLARSIRELGGRLSGAAVYAYQPREDVALSEKARKELKSLNVEYIQNVRNQTFAHYPQANKPIVCDFSERNLTHDYLVLVDTDKLVVGDFRILDAATEFDVALRPTHGKGVGYSCPQDDNYRYWNNLWKEYNIAEPRVRTVTTIDSEEICGYWNSGLVVVRRSAGVFAAWNEAITRIFKKRLEPAASEFFLDQIALATALHRHDWRVSTLPLGYNYPIHRHFMGRVPPHNRVVRADDLVTVHYHGMIRNPYFRDIFSVFENDQIVSPWLKDVLAYYKIAPHYPWRVRFYSRLKKRVREGIPG